MVRTPSVRKRGLTLVEVMVAAGLFSVAALGLMSAWPLQARAVDTSRCALMATAIAERELEVLMGQGYSAAASRAADDSATAYDNGAAVTTAFHTRTTVTSPRANLKDVVVEVTWTEGGVTHAVALETMLAPPQ